MRPAPFALLLAVLVPAAASGPSAAAPDSPGAPETVLVDLVYDGKTFHEKAFLRGEYKLVRTAYVKFFRQKYAAEIAAGFGDDADKLAAWLDANPEPRDLLFTALDPESDNLSAACKVFRDLWATYPDKLKANPNLAVAVAVTWDDPQGVYDYRGHQVRTKSLLPDAVKGVGPAENFAYFTSRESKLKGPQAQLPWEFLAHVVNHRTPESERDWAAAKYAARRARIGTIYKDVEYDKEMLRTRSEVCKLNGQPYTLESILKHGGVCAMQADFAARAAKSVMVPAEYVHGESNSGGLHAWVMWAEVTAVNKEKDAVAFTLESYGRYFGDQYYVGTLRDPKSGKDITDRDLERRLTAIGQMPQSSRQGDLLMRAFPLVRGRKELSTKGQLAYLNKVLGVYPMSERAWLELAAMHKDGKLTDAAEATRLADRALNTFAKFPDFSWRLADDLLTPQADKATRTRVFEKMVLAYEQLGRPDLACEARLKLADYQADAKDYKKAADGLATTIRKFPSEGRYVPKMMTRLAEVTKEFKGGIDLLAKFYQETLPKIPPRRGDEVSKYCVSMHEQAVAFFKENNKPKEAAATELALARIKASGRPAP